MTASKPGDVIKCLRLVNARGERVDTDYPIWGYAVQATGTGYVRVDWLIGRNEIHSLYREQGDRWVVVPPNQWPDEICTEVVARRLVE